MEKTKTSKKALQSLINDSMREAISHLELPEASKRVKKLLNRNSKKLAEVYTDILKREQKRKKKAEKFMEDAVKGKGKKSKKNKAEKEKA
ncbi:MAG TPA: hypothetical protein VIN08_23885 [Ohtaekwangia sp.]|uniref:hypothetical protein n=1 Tax=Ohtaekwangia sp. TaxID=2066019 RepID=UPI002F94712F